MAYVDAALALDPTTGACRATGSYQFDERSCWFHHPSGADIVVMNETDKQAYSVSIQNTQLQDHILPIAQSVNIQSQMVWRHRDNTVLNQSVSYVELEDDGVTIIYSACMENAASPKRITRRSRAPLAHWILKFPSTTEASNIFHDSGRRCSYIGMHHDVDVILEFNIRNWVMGRSSAVAVLMQARPITWKSSKSYTWISGAVASVLILLLLRPLF